MNFRHSKLDYRGNLISQIIYFWIEKLFLKGIKTTLTEDDLFPCPREQCSEYLFDKFEKYWEIELAKKGGADIKIALSKTLKFQFSIGGVLFLIEALLLLIQAALVSYFGSIFTENGKGTDISKINTNSIGESLGYAILISFILIYLVFNRAISDNYAYSAGIQLRTICTTAVYRKAIRLQQVTLHRISIGHVLNLISNDVYKLEFGMAYWNYIWIAPIVTIISVIIALVYIGPISLLGFAYIVLHIPMQMITGYIFGRFRYLQSITADERVNLMDQIIRGIRVIKLYVWEKSFLKYVSRIRRKEVRYANLAGFTQSTTFYFYNNCLFISLFIIYSFGIVVNSPLTSSELALAYLIFNIVRTYTVLYYGNGILTGRESIVALKRIQNVLELSESIQSCHTQTTSSSTEHPSIELIDFSASWNRTGDSNCSNNLVLKRINLKLNKAMLVAIVGPLGSGKSSLLSSLINELPGVSGNINIIGTTSYAAQEPWIFSGTFRANILFGSHHNSHRYRQVVAACSLEEDIGSFAEGDLTLIGERGVTLSGGQKARVALARAVYQEADIYLLDDPLSAVDVKVGREIFDNCVRGFLIDKIVLLVTHHIQYVKQAEEIAVMKEGSVVFNGHYGCVVQNEFCREFLCDLEKIEERNIFVVPSYDRSNEMSGLLSGDEDGESVGGNEPLSQFLTKEDYRPISSSFMTYIHFFWTGGLFMSILLLVLTVSSNALLFLSYWWIQSITTCSDTLYQNGSFVNLVNTSQSSDCPWYYSDSTYESIALLTFFTFTGSVIMCFSYFTLYYILLQASRRLHNRMLNKVLYCPMYFFQSNPSGRILNRFSKDSGFLDEQLPLFFCFFWTYGSYIIAVTIASCVTQYIMIVPFIISVLLTLSLRYYFLKTSTQVKRLESVARSPLYSHISISLLGLSTIRALRNERRMTQDFHYFQDRHSTAWYHYAMCTRWSESRLNMLASLVSIAGVFLALFSHYILGWYQLVGFSLPLLLSIPASFQYLIRWSCDVELLMVSVDRIMNYCNLIQEDTSPVTLQLPSLDSCARGGEIEFVNVSFKYSEELPYSLTNVSLRIKAGEKVGIIGRTGAGKSSLFNALCRINELSEGCILIDGVDISKLDLYAHRKRLSVIPQDPVLFSGTLRYNLDPFDEFSCEEIWTAVNSCHLQEMVGRLPDQLMSRVEEDGRNFSTGERQLLCLARTILRKNRIILIDEATANVDLHTDLLIQQAMRTNFSECTVLTIAHRIETIIDSHRIIVLNKGGLIEFDIPLFMLENENSYLSSLVTHLDRFSQLKMRNLAQKSYSTSTFV